MRKYFLILFCFLSTGLNAQIKNPEFRQMLDSLYQENNTPLISVRDFLKLDKHDLFILDTREEEEYEVSHLKNARQVGYFWFDMRKVYDIPVKSTIVVYCSVGSRSDKIAEKLIEAGYKNVFNLHGGIFEWVNEGHPVYKKNGVQTSEIHTFNKEWSRWVERGTKVN